MWCRESFSLVTHQALSILLAHDFLSSHIRSTFCWRMKMYDKMLLVYKIMIMVAFFCELTFFFIFQINLLKKALNQTLKNLNDSTTNSCGVNIVRHFKPLSHSITKALVFLCKQLPLFKAKSEWMSEWVSPKSNCQEISQQIFMRQIRTSVEVLIRLRIMCLFLSPSSSAS